MIALLDQLVSGTVFSYEGKFYEKGCTSWDKPTEEIKEQDGSLVGVPCYKCSPKLGGFFQPALGIWIPKKAKVSVS